ncbi:Vacuolar ATP synthase subunit C [Friedmanniomyces endolithicus]|nr:Vacuolar ATP synthase subunit C [Friedmanniomyces endolithicus]
MPPQTFFLVSLPTSISPADSAPEALTTLRSAVTTDYGTTYPFAIPTFKIGTLDTLVQQADDLAKLELGCKSVVDKVADSLRTLLDADEAKLAEQKVVNDRPVATYLQAFQWNKVKYRADKPIRELLDTLSKEIAAVDNDVKAKFTQYNQIKTSLAQLQRGNTGNLSQKSLTTVVDPSRVLQEADSEYLQQQLIAVPSTLTKDFLKSYESISPMVVPRSAQLLAKDDEFSLYAVTTFKKHAPEFLHKCREQRWTPRDMKFSEGGREAEAEELRKTEKLERRVWGEALRLGRTGYSDAVMAWVHVLTLRVFVETVLRYGLPLAYVCGIVKTDPKRAKKAKAALDARFADLGGNALSRDKKGKPIKDDQAGMQEMAGMGGGDQGFEPFVFYQFEIV